jgi:hypothetical protein
VFNFFFFQQMYFTQLCFVGSIRNFEILRTVDVIYRSIDNIDSAPS